MRVGIAVITKNREKVVNFSYQQHLKNSMVTDFLIIDDNSTTPTVLADSPYQPYYSQEWLGVAGARNKALSALDECDYIFLMDDDAFPIIKNWQDVFIKAHEMYPEQHILIASPNDWGEVVTDYSKKFVWTDGTMYESGPVSVRKPTAVLFFLTRHALKTLGGFEVFGKYGFEDVDYYIRADQAGLTPLGQYVTVKNCERFLHVCDVKGSYPGLEWEGRSVLHDEKHQMIEEAREKLTARLKNNKIFKPYK